MSRMPNEIAPSGLAMKSTAPRSSASNVALAPSTVDGETITTGQGRSSMMRSRQARPSICGICMSSVMTSGANAVELLQRLDPVAGGAHLEIGLGAENLAKQLPHQRGVVDDQDLDHKLA